ncbi:hypothetical protein Tco_1173716 [Tanacetum coccineum]
MHQQTTPIPTPPITTIAPNVAIHSSDLLNIVQRVFILEKDVQEIKQVDYSIVLVESIRSQVPPAVKEYIGLRLGDALQTVLQKHTEELIQQSSQKDVSKIRKTKQESAANEKMPKGKKTKRRRTKESELSKKSSTSQGKSSPKTSKSDKPVHVEESSVVPTEEVIMDAANDNVVIDVDQPQYDLEPKID